MFEHKEDLEELRKAQQGVVNVVITNIAACVTGTKEVSLLRDYFTKDVYQEEYRYETEAGQPRHRDK